MCGDAQFKQLSQYMWASSVTYRFVLGSRQRSQSVAAVAFTSAQVVESGRGGPILRRIRQLLTADSETNQLGTRLFQAHFTLPFTTNRLPWRIGKGEMSSQPQALSSCRPHLESLNSESPIAQDMRIRRFWVDIVQEEPNTDIVYQCKRLCARTLLLV
jgi:hypothetical protein